MSNQHKHAAEIKAWAEGALIEYYNSFQSLWIACPDNNPSWFPENQYRVKPTPDPLKEFKEAFFAGKDVEWQSSDGVWCAVGEYCGWSPKFNYRLKPSAPHKWQHLIDAQAAGKAVQYRQIGSDQWNNSPHWNFNGTGEYRLKPETIKFRNFLWKSIWGTRVVIVCSEKEQEADDRTKWVGFIHWIGDWQEVEIPS